MKGIGGLSQVMSSGQTYLAAIWGMIERDRFESTTDDRSVQSFPLNEARYEPSNIFIKKFIDKSTDLNHHFIFFSFHIF